MSSLEKEDDLDRALSGQTKADRLIDSAAALIAGLAFDFRLSHTVDGIWRANELEAKAEHDAMLEMARELKVLKRSCPEIPDRSDHVADASKMVQGDLVQAGKLTMKDAEYERAVVIAFDDDESARKAIQSGQCRFSVFGGEV